MFIGPASDKTSAFSSLGPEWINSSVQQSIPSGNGAILLSKPYSVYYELCEYIEEWQDRFIVLHLSGGLQIGVELMNLLPAFGQCLIICDSVPQSIRNSEAKTITPKELMKQMSCLLVFRAGAATKDLIEILPTYVYEKITDTFSINSHRGRSVFHPLRRHRGRSFSMGSKERWNTTKTCLKTAICRRFLKTVLCSCITQETIKLISPSWRKTKSKGLLFNAELPFAFFFVC